MPRARLGAWPQQRAPPGPLAGDWRCAQARSPGRPRQERPNGHRRARPSRRQAPTGHPAIRGSHGPSGLARERAAPRLPAGRHTRARSSAPRRRTAAQTPRARAPAPPQAGAPAPRLLAAHLRWPSHTPQRSCARRERAPWHQHSPGPRCHQGWRSQTCPRGHAWICRARRSRSARFAPPLRLRTSRATRGGANGNRLYPLNSIVAGGGLMTQIATQAPLRRRFVSGEGHLPSRATKQALRRCVFSPEGTVLQGNETNGLSLCLIRRDRPCGRRRPREARRRCRSSRSCRSQAHSREQRP